MTNLRNKVQLIGHIGVTPELIKFDGGNTTITLRIATNETYTNKAGEKVENTEWHNVIAWGKQAELIASLVKQGTEIAVEGKLTSRSYEDKNKIKRYVTEIQLNQFTLLGKKAA